MDINKELAREYALVTAFMLEMQNEGTIFQMFDECYALAEAFVKKFPLNTNWEEIEKDYDEEIWFFIIENKPLWTLN